jgi:AhpD family alkylhydroperoxidase
LNLAVCSFVEAPADHETGKIVHPSAFMIHFPGSDPGSSLPCQTTKQKFKSKKMSKFTVPTRDQVGATNQAIFDTLNKALGFVPNLYATIAYSENGLDRYLNFQNAKTSLSNKEKEAVNLVVSEVNNCQYCKSAHTILGKMNGFSDKQLLEIRREKSDLPKLDALVKLAASITRTRGNAPDSLVDEFFAQGYTKENLVDLVLQVSDKTAMNYLHNLTKIPVDFPLAPALEAEAVLN